MRVCPHTLMVAAEDQGVPGMELGQRSPRRPGAREGEAGRQWFLGERQGDSGPWVGAGTSEPGPWGSWKGGGGKAKPT